MEADALAQVAGLPSTRGPNHSAYRRETQRAITTDDDWIMPNFLTIAYSSLALGRAGQGRGEVWTDLSKLACRAARSSTVDMPVRSDPSLRADAGGTMHGWPLLEGCAP